MNELSAVCQELEINNLAEELENRLSILSVEVAEISEYYSLLPSSPSGR